MSNITADVKLIMTLFKNAADDHSSRNKSTRTTNNEVSPALMHAIGILVQNILEREDFIKKEFEEKLIANQKLYEDKLSDSKREINELRAGQRKLMFDLDAQAQYNRSENIKIHNIKYTANEDTNNIIKDLGKYAGVPITDADISISHRLMSKEELLKLGPNSKAPPLIARFNRRNIATRLLGARKNIMANTETPLNLKNTAMYEDVTPMKSRILFQLRNRDDKKAFKFVWS